MEKPKGAQVGDGNTQHNTFLPQGPNPPTLAASGGSLAASFTAGDNATITNTQKKTNLRFSVPIFGPLFAAMATHPVAAAIVTVAVVAGVGTGGAAIEHSVSQPGSPSLAVIRGFKMEATEQGIGGNTYGSVTGYDFSKTTPLAGLGAKS
jgi:hypothetical protein